MFAKRGNAGPAAVKSYSQFVLLTDLSRGYFMKEERCHFQEGVLLMALLLQGLPEFSMDVGKCPSCNQGMCAWQRCLPVE